MAKVAWIGLGNMGIPMSSNLLAAGNEVVVWNRTASKCDALVSEGAKKAGTPAEAAKGAEYIFTMVADSAAMCDCIMGDKGVISALSGGEIVIDMSTVSIESSAQCNEGIVAKGATFLRAPVSGSTVLAKSGALTVLCSGPKDSFDKTVPLFEKISKAQFYLGDGDGARAMKLGLNMMIGISMQMFAEALVLCEKAGIDPNIAMDVIGGSVLNSPFIAYKMPPIRERKFNPAFSTRLMAKDLGLALSVTEKLQMSAPTTALTKQLLESLIAQGHSELDVAALVLQMETMAGMDPQELK